MRPANRSAYLLNIVFLTGLLLLALNDHLFKDLYGNWWTGKLSDVAGVLILPLFLKYLTGWRNGVVVLLTVAFFTWFKSPLSTGALDFINGFGLVHLVRVVDYTDLLAFAALPVSWLVLKNPARFGFGAVTLRHRALVRYGVLPLALLLFVATSDDEDFRLDGSVNNCCSYNPVDLTIGDGYVYIPTAFTPNGDGINDVFRVMVDSNVVFMDSIRIYPGDFLSGAVFSADSLTDFTPSTSWDGTDAAGVITPGSYEYFVSLTARNGTSQSLIGRVCVLPCPNPGENQTANFVGQCTFGNQVDSLGRFDRNVESFETIDCY